MKDLLELLFIREYRHHWPEPISAHESRAAPPGHAPWMRQSQPHRLMAESVPRSKSKLSTLPHNRCWRTYVVTIRRMTLGDESTWRNECSSRLVNRVGYSQPACRDIAAPNQASARQGIPFVGLISFKKIFQHTPGALFNGLVVHWGDGAEDDSKISL